MNKNLAKVTSLLAVMAMGASVLAGCSDEKAEQTEQTPSPSAVAAESGAFVPQKTLELSYWWSHGSDIAAVSNPKENIPGDWIEKKSGVKIKEGIGNSGQDPIVKLGMMTAGNMLPHLAFSTNQIGFDKALEGKQLWELTPEMLKKYAPDVWSSLPEYTWEPVKKDGKIYGIPYELASTVFHDVKGRSAEWLDYYGPSPQSATWNINMGQCFLIRDDILKQLYPSALGYDEALTIIKEKNERVGDKFILPIKTTDDYVKLMYDIKNLGLKADNKPVYAFGYPKGDNWTALTALGGEMIGYKTYNYMSMYNSITKKLEFGLLTPGVKEAAKIQNKMINDNVIDPESVVHTSEQFKEKILKGQYAITTVLATGMVGISNIANLNAELKKNGKTYQYVPLITQIPNKPEYPAQYTVPVKGGANNYIWFFKTLKEEDLPQVLNWINIMFTEEWEDIKYWGPKEAGLYTEVNGKRVFKDEKLQKGLVEGDKSIDPKELKGFFTRNQNNLNTDIRRYPPDTSYEFMNRNDVSKNIISALTKFSIDSPYGKNVLPMPEFGTWKADYKDIPAVKELLAKRGVWEDAFKYPLVAKNEEQFEKKWQEAINTLKQNVNIDQLLEEQEKIFMPMLEEINSRK
ncbi:MAG: hypothetical protein K0R57_3087 [Paenibacillaceae bacterium]|jgi:ABC-type glycerol-3-phosphate transport system substrate-binding protein|nr:hypothetical protein [Paenibacillaceae bacterium]